MNSQRSIWSDSPLSVGIATLVCYAGVFNDVISVEEIAARLAMSGRDQFYAAINELHRRGRLIIKDGFAALPDCEDKLAIKNTKINTARDLINSRLDALEKLGRNPLIRFVGVSGSLAAGNPTKDRNNEVDIDVFVLTRNQCLWLYNIWRSLKNNLCIGLKNIFPAKERKLRLCLNYLMDESDSLIANRNFYTATEVRNLIPISGSDAYRQFLQVNNWVNYYYPGTSGAVSPPAFVSAHWVNKFFFAAYSTLRDIKWGLKTHPLKKLSSHRGTNFNVVGPQCGGYQAMVQKKFSGLAEKWFPDLLSADLLKKLFPDQLSREIRSGELNVPEVLKRVGLEFDYGKYG